ncbi:MAG: hypothetical protein P8100_13900, partial [bacterium]
MKSLFRCIIALPFLFLWINYSTGQSYTGYNLPLEVRSAYQKGTRSVTGMPGPNYWQNSARYKIKAELLHEESQLSAEEVVVYYNNSPDTLENIVIRLYQDIYKKGNPRQFPIDAEALTDGILIRSFLLNGESIDLDDRKRVRKTATNLIVGLQSPLHPGDSATMEISWQFDISLKRPLRMGNYGDDRFFVAYWYPQVAVYDDIDGWDLVEYAGMVEFYNDFNDFDVEITTNDGFMVWATGELENRKEIFSGQVLEKYYKALDSDEIEMIFTAEDCRKGKVLKEAGQIKWRFKASHVPDFSFASTRFANWEASSVLVDEEKGRRVLVDAVYDDSARTFMHTAEQARNSVAYMSRILPGYPFPYNHMTNFDNGRNGGGMETPMMANNGDPKGLPNASATIFHEIAHTYFPFFMGVNERKYAWMDEGWSAFFPCGFMEKDSP